jgi:hypothetical protein
MAIKRFTVVIPTNASGVGTGYTPVFSGQISQMRYVKDGSNGYENGVDFAITLEATGETVWTENDVNASATVAPRQATHTTAGVAQLYASGGSAVLDKIVAFADRVVIAVSSATAGTTPRTGTFHVIVE